MIDVVVELLFRNSASDAKLEFSPEIFAEDVLLDSFIVEIIVVCVANGVIVFLVDCVTVSVVLSYPLLMFEVNLLYVLGKGCDVKVSNPVDTESVVIVAEADVVLV